MKNTIIIILILLAVVFGFYLLNQKESDIEEQVEEQSSLTVEETTDIEEMDEMEEQEVAWSRKSIIGTSVEGKNIIAYKYGTGEKELLFVGGIHGGYSWNTAVVAYDIIEYIEDNKNIIPDNIQVTIVPVLNPDGLSNVAEDYGPGLNESDISGTESEKVAARFNANDVDLNRNFACDWQENAKWQNKDVSGGDEAFSEPEAKAIRDYVAINNPTAAVVWYSAAGGVYSSSCHNGVLSETSELNDLYSKASGYPSYKEFDFYATTGDFVNWLAKESIPAISVLLTTHDSPETNKNINGLKALLNYYK